MKITGETDVTVEREIFGNKITIHHFLEDSSSGKEVIGGVQNKKAGTGIWANAKDVLEDRIAVIA